MFYVREVKVGHEGCRYRTNINEEARMPFLDNQVYMCTSSKGESSAWVSPSVSLDPLNEVMLEELRQVSRSRSGWSVLMTVIREESQDKVDDALLFGNNGAVPLQVPKTAKKAKQMPRSLNETDVFPTNLEDTESGNYPADLIEKLNGLFRRVARVEDDVVAHEVETATDLGNLQVQVTKTDGRIGSGSSCK
eukprot:scaffold142622_cov53-Attheya_sp.AAC.3